MGPEGRLELRMAGSDIQKCWDWSLESGVLRLDSMVAAQSDPCWLSHIDPFHPEGQ